ncbi:MAG: calcium/sodium antiporter [Microlunatus sp.]|nr:calcium/sodium antiporter [Microlunatus sp.]
MPPVVWIILGLAALIGGAELVVRYGARLASRLGLPPILVGLTVVSLGTSLPELAVGIDAVRSDAGALAVGNIVGTNIVNLLLILGLSAAIRAVSIELQTLRLELPMMAAAAVLPLVLAGNGLLARWEGVPLVALAVAYTLLLIRWTRRENARVLAEYGYQPGPAQRGRTVALYVGLLVAGLVVIVVGSQWLVDGAVRLATALGVSDAVIGLTVVAIGTSAPELATTIISTIRGDRDIAIGNLIGSSIYNLTIILGVALLAAPGTVAIDRELVFVDLPVMVLVSLACILLMRTDRTLSRAEGTGFVVAYAVYLGYLLIART